MHLKAFSGWLLLAPVLGSALAGHAEQEVLAGWDSTFETPEQVPVEKPHFPPHRGPAKSTGTIYQALANDTRFTLITKAITFVEDIGALLNDSSSTLTFFAPPDAVLRPPPGSPPPPPKNVTPFDAVRFAEGDENSMLALISQYRDLAEVAPMLEELDITADDEDDKRKKIFKIILRAILSYHILPGAAYGIPDLTKNVTYPTNLRIPGAFGGESLRLRVTQSVFPPAVHVNFVTKVIREFKAANGIVHVVNHALLPPPSVFQELYLIPHVFSTFTSALQRSNLTDGVDLRFSRGHGLEGTPLVTVFAPTNKAFEALPKKLQFFLFSPFGARVLKKLLEFHIVPNAVIHSNYINGEVVAANLDLPGQPPFEHAPPPKFPIHVKPVFSRNLTLETLFENHTLSAHIVQHEVSFPAIPGHKKPSIISTKIFVNGGPPAVLTDVVSLNGAIHVVDRLLDPRKQHHKHHRKHPHHPGPDHEHPSPPFHHDHDHPPPPFHHDHEHPLPPFHRDHEFPPSLFHHDHEHSHPPFHVHHDHHRGVDFTPVFAGLNGIPTGPPPGHSGAHWGHGKGLPEHGPGDHHDEHPFEGRIGHGHRHGVPHDEHRPEGRFDVHMHGDHHDERRPEGKFDRHMHVDNHDDHQRERGHDRQLRDGDEHRRGGKDDERVRENHHDDRREGKPDGPRGHEGKHDGEVDERPRGELHGHPKRPHEPFGESRHDIWADWETWLPQWAEQD